jgi:hypothetical protein
MLEKTAGEYDCPSESHLIVVEEGSGWSDSRESTSYGFKCFGSERGGPTGDPVHAGCHRR